MTLTVRIKWTRMLVAECPGILAVQGQRTPVAEGGLSWDRGELFQLLDMNFTRIEDFETKVSVLGETH